MEVPRISHIYDIQSTKLQKKSYDSYFSYQTLYSYEAELSIQIRDLHVILRDCGRLLYRFGPLEGTVGGLHEDDYNSVSLRRLASRCGWGGAAPGAKTCPGGRGGIHCASSNSARTLLPKGTCDSSAIMMTVPSMKCSRSPWNC